MELSELRWDFGIVLYLPFQLEVDVNSNLWAVMSHTCSKIDILSSGEEIKFKLRFWKFGVLFFKSFRMKSTSAANLYFEPLGFKLLNVLNKINIGNSFQIFPLSSCWYSEQNLTLRKPMSRFGVITGQKSMFYHKKKEFT